MHNDNVELVLFPAEGADSEIPELLKLHEVAQLLRVADRTVRAWIAQGLLPVVRIGGTQRCKQRDVRALIERATAIHREY